MMKSHLWKKSAVRSNAAIVDDPPFTIKEGGLIKEGFSSELDELKALYRRRPELDRRTGRQRTGTNRHQESESRLQQVFGYYLEVTKSYYDLIPENYIRKQTLSNCERFITPELKETERLVLNAETKINQLEYDLFLELRQNLQQYIGQIQKTSRAIASLDVLTSFAEVSEKYGYVKPQVDDGDVIRSKRADILS